MAIVLALLIGYMCTLKTTLIFGAPCGPIGAHIHLLGRDATEKCATFISFMPALAVSPFASALCPITSNDNSYVRRFLNQIFMCQRRGDHSKDHEAAVATPAPPENE